MFRYEFCCFLRNWMKKHRFVSSESSCIYINICGTTIRNKTTCNGEKKNIFFLPNYQDREWERKRNRTVLGGTAVNIYSTSVCVYIPLYLYIYYIFYTCLCSSIKMHFSLTRVHLCMKYNISIVPQCLAVVCLTHY